MPQVVVWDVHCIKKKQFPVCNRVCKLNFDLYREEVPKCETRVLSVKVDLVR